jgi:hypothetical protein
MTESFRSARARKGGEETEPTYWKAETWRGGWILHNSASAPLEGTPFSLFGKLINLAFPSSLENQAEKCPGPVLEREGIRVKARREPFYKTTRGEVVFYIAAPPGTGLTVTEEGDDLLVGKGKRPLFRLRPSGEVEAV